MSTKEQNRLQILNGVLERCWGMPEAAPLLGISERQGRRLLCCLGGYDGLTRAIQYADGAPIHSSESDGR